MPEMKEPLFEVAQLAHVELLTPKPDDTLWFFKELLGMEESGRQGQSVYLRAYEDFYHHTLKITESVQTGSGHVAWRATSPQALERRVVALEATGLGKGWIEGDLGHGRAYQFTTPDGHKMESLVGRRLLPGATREAYRSLESTPEAASTWYSGAPSRSRELSCIKRHAQSRIHGGAARVPIERARRAG